MFCSYKLAAVYKIHYIKQYPAAGTMYVHRGGNHAPIKKPSEYNYLEEACCCASFYVKSNTLSNRFAIPQ